MQQFFFAAAGLRRGSIFSPLARCNYPFFQARWL